MGTFTKSKISGRMIGYGWGNVCKIVNFPPGEYLLYSKVSEGGGGGGEVYSIANILKGEYLLYSKHSGRKVCYADGLLYDNGT